MTGALGVRSGPRPATTSRFPHQQLDQQPDDPTLRRRLIAAAAARFDHVHLKPSGISVPGAWAWVLDPGVPAGPAEAFLTGTEFAHLHPAPDHSLHLALPVPVVRSAVAAGWAEAHIGIAAGLVAPTVVLLYAPRDDRELTVVLSLLQQSFRFATKATVSLLR